MTLDRITFDPNKVAGQACIRRLRIALATAVRCAASGVTTADLLAAFPNLGPEDVRQALEYPARLTEERLVRLGP